MYFGILPRKPHYNYCDFLPHFKGFIYSYFLAQVLICT
jgi:hypothetical protein